VKNMPIKLSFGRDKQSQEWLAIAKTVDGPRILGAGKTNAQAEQQATNWLRAWLRTRRSTQ